MSGLQPPPAELGTIAHLARQLAEYLRVAWPPLQSNTLPACPPPEPNTLPLRLLLMPVIQRLFPRGSRLRLMGWSVFVDDVVRRLQDTVDRIALTLVGRIVVHDDNSCLCEGLPTLIQTGPGGVQVLSQPPRVHAQDLADLERLTNDLARASHDPACLNPTLAPPAPAQTLPPARHSPDFRSVDWFGTPYTFTASQAACVTLLWAAWKQGTPEMSDETILELAEFKNDRLYTLFRRHPAWGTMIQPGTTKGTHRLAEPAR
jgi:hypothetical protein